MIEKNKIYLRKRKVFSFLNIFDLKIVGFSFVLCLFFFLFSTGLIGICLNEEKDENTSALLSSFLSIDYVITIIYTIFPIYLIVLFVYTAVTHINDKNRVYIYYVGRSNDFFNIYLVSFFKRATKIFFSFYSGCILLVLILFLINLSFFSNEMLNEVISENSTINISTFGSRFIIQVDSHFENIEIFKQLYKMPNFLFLIVIWLPMYGAMLTFPLMIVLINEFIRNIIISVLSIICFYFLLNPVLKILNLEVFEPMYFISFVIKHENPIQYLMVPIIINVLIIFVLNHLRKMWKLSEI